MSDEVRTRFWQGLRGWLYGAGVHARREIVPGHVVQQAGAVVVDVAHAGHVGNDVVGEATGEPLQHRLHKAFLLAAEPIGAHGAHAIDDFRIDLPFGVDGLNDFRDTEGAHRDAGRDAAYGLQGAFAAIAAT